MPQKAKGVYKAPKARVELKGEVGRLMACAAAVVGGENADNTLLRHSLVNICVIAANYITVGAHSDYAVQNVVSVTLRVEDYVVSFWWLGNG